MILAAITLGPPIAFMAAALMECHHRIEQLEGARKHLEGHE